MVSAYTRESQCDLKMCGEKIANICLYLSFIIEKEI